MFSSFAPECYVEGVVILYVQMYLLIGQVKAE